MNAAALGQLNATASDLPNASGLNSLRAAAAQKDPKAIDATAKQFESLFAQQLMKSMRDASGSDAMFPGDAKTYRDLYDREVANHLSQGKGLGMQAMIRKALGAKSDAATATSTASATRTKATGMSLAHYSRTLLPQHAAATTNTTPTTTSTRVPAAVAPTSNNTASTVKAMTALAAYRLPGSVATTSTLSHGSGRPSPLTSDANPTTPTSPGAPNRSFSQEDFVTQVWPHAQRAAAALGVSPQALVAQAALESGWGKHVSGDNNLFGIKAGASWTGATKSLSTSEFSNGQLHKETATFRSYASIGDSFDDYVNVLKNSPRYAGVLNTGYDTQRFAGALQKAGYATDPNYAAKIASIAHGAVVADVLQKSSTVPLLASK